MITNLWKEIVAPVSQGGLLGAPFGWGARGPQYFDCWGLVVEIRKRLQEPVPDDWENIDNDYSLVLKVFLYESKKSFWVKVPEFEPGNIIALSRNKFIHHVGIMTPWGIMHTIKNCGAIIQSARALKREGYSLIQAYKYVE